MGIRERQDRERHAVREAILTSARDLFVAEGYAQVSIRKIAERIEYSPAAIYSYFPEQRRHLLHPGGRRLPAARPRHRGRRRRRRPDRGPAQLLVGVLPVLQGPARVLPPDVRRPVGAGHHRAVAGLRPAPADARRAWPRESSAPSTPDAFPATLEPAGGAARAVGGAHRPRRPRLHLPARRPTRTPTPWPATSSTRPSPAWPPAPRSASCPAHAAQRPSFARLPPPWSHAHEGSSSVRRARRRRRAVGRLGRLRRHAPPRPSAAAAARPAAVDVAAVTAAVRHHRVHARAVGQPGAAGARRHEAARARRASNGCSSTSARRCARASRGHHRPPRNRRAGRRADGHRQRRQGRLDAPRPRSPTPRLELERARNLFEKGALPRQRLDAAETANKASVAQRELARARLAQADAA